MVNVSIARRYARALLEAAGPAADQVLLELEQLVASLDSSAELLDVFTNPAWSRAQREGVVEAVLKASGGVQLPLANLVRLLNDRNRVAQLPDIARLYRDLVDVRLGRVRGKISSAITLDASVLKQLEESLEKVTQRDVLLDAKVDPELLGGVTAQVGGVIYDGSLRSQLNALGQSLK